MGWLTSTKMPGVCCGHTHSHFERTATDSLQYPRLKHIAYGYCTTKTGFAKRVKCMHIGSSSECEVLTLKRRLLIKQLLYGKKNAWLYVQFAGNGYPMSFASVCGAFTITVTQNNRTFCCWVNSGSFECGHSMFFVCKFPVFCNRKNFEWF
jgi:hypothetical protein